MRNSDSFTNEYDLLIELVNCNLNKNKKESIVFELSSNLSEDIFDFPIQNLLDIEDHSLFIHESYYKILDRPVDRPSYEHFLKLLNDRKITKDHLIYTLSNSAERRIKKSNLKNAFNEDRV